MTPRQIRRAAERTALKASRKADTLNTQAHHPENPAEIPDTTPTESPNPTPRAKTPQDLDTIHSSETLFHITRQDLGIPDPTQSVRPRDEDEHPTLSEAQLAANRANAQFSTGPRTDEGKAAVSQNRRSHGLCGAFLLLDWEDEEQFDKYMAGLYRQHDPATEFEEHLLRSVAQHFWLMQRALTLQNELLRDPEIDHKAFALYLRYQTTNERSYYKALRELVALQNQRRKADAENGFESQKRRAVENARQQELHQAKVRLANARAADCETQTMVRSTMEIPLPGHTRIPLEDLKQAFTVMLHQFNGSLQEKMSEKAAA